MAIRHRKKISLTLQTIVNKFNVKSFILDCRRANVRAYYLLVLMPLGFLRAIVVVLRAPAIAVLNYITIWESRSCGNSNLLHKYTFSVQPFDNIIICF